MSWIRGASWARARRHWHLLGLHDDIVERASRPFPGAPVRTLDAIHLARALAARAAFPELTILSLDASIRRTGIDLGWHNAMLEVTIPVSQALQPKNWAATAEAHAALAREAEQKGRTVSAGEAYVRAALCFHFAKFVWLLDLQRHRWAADQAVAHLYAAHRLLDPTAERVEIPFEGTTMVAICAAAGRGPAPAGAPPTRPRVDERGVLLLGERSPDAWDGHALPRRSWPGGDGVHDVDPSGL